MGVCIGDKGGRGYKTKGTGHGTQDTGHVTRDTGHGTRAARTPKVKVNFSLLAWKSASEDSGRRGAESCFRTPMPMPDWPPGVASAGPPGRGLGGRGGALKENGSHPQTWTIKWHLRGTDSKVRPGRVLRAASFFLQRSPSPLPSPATAKVRGAPFKNYRKNLYGWGGSCTKKPVVQLGVKKS